MALHKSFLIIILASQAISVSARPDDPTPTTRPVENEAAELPPLPFLGGEERFEWWIHGDSIGNTRVTAEPVKESDGKSHILVKGSFDFDWMGRLVTGTTETLYDGSISRPIHYQHVLNLEAAGVGQSQAMLVATFEDGTAEVQSREGDDDLVRVTVERPSPTWLLDDQCFEHWVLLAPYLEKILKDGALTVFIPRTATTAQYRLVRERTEGEGEKARVRWAVSGPSVEAKLWVDRSGRLVEYTQGDLQIVRQAPPAADDETTAPSPKSEDPPTSPPKGSRDKAGSGSVKDR